MPPEDPQPAGVFLDVGAHKGESSLDFAVQNPDATIYAFEPNLLVASEWCYRLPNLHLIPMAVGESDGFRSFHFNSETATSSLYPFEEKRLAAWIGGESLRTESTRLVPCIRLDTFMRRLGIEAVEFLKIDAQGADLEIARSAGSRLESVRRVKLEVAVTDSQLYRGAASKSTVRKFMESHGFVLVAEEPQTFGQEENLTFERSALG